MPCHIRHALLLLATLGAAACTTLTVEQRTAACQATDWAEFGRNDDILGVAEGERTKQFADCAGLGYPADIAAYQAGRTEGLASYCTLENGYEAGYAGRRYRDVCPPELEIAFLQGYRQGRKERPRDFYPYYGFGFGYGFGFSHYPYFGLRLGHRGHHRRYRGDGHRRRHRGAES